MNNDSASHNTANTASHDPGASARNRPLQQVSLDDKYTRRDGRVFMSGIQALVRLPLELRWRDNEQGHDTAGYITGYRGSPLGSYDIQLNVAAKFLGEQQVVFNPGVNEDLAATACWGTQQAQLNGEGRHDGVFSIWYGKGPGVDRSGDALRHGNLAGTSPLGGVLCLLGDDHTCESSTTSHHSEYAMVDAMIPTLNPAGVQEILDYGVLGIALSRFSGAWVALKCVHDTVEASASVTVDTQRVQIRLPQDYHRPEEGLHIRWPDTPQQQERRLHEHKLEAAKAFCRANQLDQTILDSEQSKIGLMTTGKSYLDVCQALEDLGIDAAAAQAHGLRLYKVAMPFPLEPQGAAAFAKGLDKVIVVEEKRALLETQLKDLLYGSDQAPLIIGKRDEDNAMLFPSAGRLDSNHIAVEIGKRLIAANKNSTLNARVEALQDLLDREAPAIPDLQRTPYFCPGCPHSTSTHVPEGSRALAGIGCHYLAQFMDRETERYTQMGAEGASWIGEAHFSQRGHMFQNIGDGTYFHSGLLAIRAAIASGVNITFKILYNDAVAMTGGQGMDGALSVARMSQQVHAEGAQQVVVVTDEPDKYLDRTEFAGGVSIHHRDALDRVQRQLREVSGTTVLIYDQTCAAEKRRRRKRGLFPDPAQRIFINQSVCEGCGDCGVASNCLAVVPLETEFGRKRAIDQSSCNKDYSCAKGFCPSFVTVHGGTLKKGKSINQQADPGDQIAEPEQPPLDRPYGIVIAGVGGTGIVTIGALIGMAAHIDGRGCSILDQLGLAQKGGAVVSHLKIALRPEEINATRIASGGADLVLGGDLLVTGSPATVETMAVDRTQVIVNSQPTMPGDFTRLPDLVFPGSEIEQRIKSSVGEDNTEFFNATRLATALLGDSIASNLLLLGFIFQKGLLPISSASIIAAIKLNGVAVDMNLLAFSWGRRAANDMTSVITAAFGQQAEIQVPVKVSLAATVQRRAAFLEAYQDQAYAETYKQFVDNVLAIETQQCKGLSGLAQAVAENYFKLLAYKDEYEVARLYTQPEFQQALDHQFEGDFTLEFHLSPPLLAGFNRSTGRPNKRRYGAWMMKVFKFIAPYKRLRGTWSDPFGYTQERRMERKLIIEYQELLKQVLDSLNSENHQTAVALASVPEKIRGYGPVKADNVNQARQLQSQLLDEFINSKTASAAA